MKPKSYERIRSNSKRIRENLKKFEKLRENPAKFRED